MAELVGRDEELAALDRFVGRPRPAALVLDGEPGIGKTSLWREGVRRAQAAGQHVLSASPTESETQMPFAALGDLLAEAIERVGAKLPRPQRRALGIALLLDEPDDAPAERRAVALAVLSVLRLFAAAVPLVLAIDDVQWLDADSQDALAFAFRRLGEMQVGLVLARRSEQEDDALPLGLDPALVPVESVRLRGLSLGATGALVRRHTGLSFRRPVIRQIHEASLGNPLFAVGLAEGLVRDSVTEVEELPLPRSMHEVVQDRIAALPASTRETLVVVAALSNPTRAVLEKSVGPALDAHLLPACDARVVEAREDVVRFTHPLLRAAVYASALPATRKEVHRRLSELDLSLEERARHLAISASPPDRPTASILEEAARAAALRGASAVAARLATQAIEYSDPDDAESLRRRRYLAADEYAAAGDLDRARREVEAIVAAAPSGPIRARALLRLAKNPRDIAESATLCEQALAEARDDSVLRIDVLLFLAKLTLVLGQRERTTALLREATEIAAALGDDARRWHIEIWQAFVAWAGGHAFNRDILDRARAVDDTLLDHRASLEDRASYIRALLLRNINELDEARRAWLDLEQIAVESGDETAHADILNNLAKIEAAAGDWDEGARYHDEAVELAEEVGLDHALATNLADRAEHAAMRGEVEAARADAVRSLEIAARTHEEFTVARARNALALAALSVGDYEQAVSESRQALAIVKQLQYFGGVGTRVLPVVVDATLGHGDVEEAHVATRQLEELAATSSLPSVHSEARRCRGLVLASQGDLAEALACLSEAAALAAEVPLRFEEARALLALGTVQRRARQRAAARETLRAALAIFDSLGAPIWADQVRLEVGRIGGRAASPEELTPTEQRVAALVAEGKTNKEVAAELVVSVRAVEANLSRIYTKLGIRSRAELARHFRTKESSP